MTRTKTESTTCDACRREIPKGGIKYLPLKTCCSVQQIPLCRECYAKYAGKKEIK